MLLTVLTGLLTSTATAQTYIDQHEVEEVLTSHRIENLDDLPEVYYEYHVLTDPDGNTVKARNRFYKEIGDGDVELGHKRAKVVQLINRTLIEQMKVGDTLVVPRQFEIDFRAFSPFPRYYPGARNFDKLFIIHKSIQAWAAYENGQLSRWGIVNTGARENPTPTGRYNFNWKEEYRVSSLSPVDEQWEMYWVFNFHQERGIHVHQYAMPTGGPDSHGCVRLVDTDARWIYNWAEPWKTTVAGVGFNSGQGRVVKQGTTVLVLGDDPVGVPHPFEYKKRYPILMRVELPSDPYEVPAGTPQQQHFDRQRLRASR